MRKLTISALLICLPGLLVADIYRWVDKRGVVNYTQQKPNNVAFTMVGKSTSGQRPTSTDTAAPVAATADAQDRQAALTSTQKNKLDELKAQEEQRAIALVERQRANCAKAQSALEQLTTSSRIRVRAEDGSVRAIPEEERQSRIEETQLAIAENCV